MCVVAPSHALSSPMRKKPKPHSCTSCSTRSGSAKIRHPRAGLLIASKNSAGRPTRHVSQPRPRTDRAEQCNRDPAKCQPDLHICSRRQTWCYDPCVVCDDTDRSNQTITALGYGFEEARLTRVLAEGLTQLGYGSRESGFAHSLR